MTKYKQAYYGVGNVGILAGICQVYGYVCYGGIVMRSEIWMFSFLDFVWLEKLKLLILRAKKMNYE